MNFFTMRVSGSERTVVPRALRRNELERLIMPWRLPAWPALILPEAVILKRFLAPDFVFILGILLVLLCIFQLSETDVRTAVFRVKRLE